MATCAARFGSIHRGRVQGHSGARIRAPCAYRCPPLSTFVVCAPCVIAGGGCCCSGARIDERARPDAAARCSTSAWITRSAWDHRALRQIDALLRFRWAPGAPRWPTVLPRAPLASRRPVKHELFASGGDRALGADDPRVGRDWDVRCGPRYSDTAKV